MKYPNKTCRQGKMQEQITLLVNFTKFLKDSLKSFSNSFKIKRGGNTIFTYSLRLAWQKAKDITSKVLTNSSYEHRCKNPG